MKRKCGGFSLIELIVVIGIMVVLAGVAVLSYNIVRRSNVDKAASNITSAYNKARTYAMSKSGTWSLEVKKTDGTYYGYIYQTSTDGTTTKVNTYELGKYYTLEFSSDDSLTATINNSDSVIIEFNANGSIKSVNLGDGTNYYTDGSSTGTYCVFHMEYGSRSGSVTVYYSTGKSVKE